jgi:hypothetical protein
MRALHSPHRSMGVYALAHPGDPFRALPLRRQGPAPQHGAPYLSSWKLLLARQFYESLGLGLRRWCLAAQTVQLGRKVERIGEAMGMHELLGQHDGLIAPLPRVLRIAQIPQSQGDMPPAADPQDAAALDMV